MLCLVWLPLIVFGQEESVPLFNPDLIKADIDTLISTLIAVHPTFHEHYLANDLEGKIERIKNHVNSPMSSQDFFRIMQPIVAIDGHTTLRHSGGICPGEDHPLFPFRVVIYKGTLYIKDNLTEVNGLGRGSIISRINGVPARQIISNLLRYVPGEKEAHKTKSLENQFHIFMALVYGSFTDFTLTVNNSDIQLKGATWSDFDEPPKPKFELRFYDDDIAYIYKRLFMPPADFMHFIDSAFTEISIRDIDYLIIDNLRGGGFTDLADSLMSYFTDKHYRMIDNKLTKVSPFTTAFIEDKKTEGYFRNGYFVQDYPVHSENRKNQFSGSTYILTGPLSYSAATCFSAAAQCYGNAILVGEESGQPLLSNGDQNSFVLPNTQISCITALSIVGMPCNNDDQLNGVHPDYEIDPTLDDLLNDEAYQLKYILKLIRESKSHN